MSDFENRNGVAILVPVKAIAPRTARVDVTVPEDVLARIDAYAGRHGTNRSGFLVHAATREMEANTERA